MTEPTAASPAGFLDSLPPWAARLVRAVRAKQASTFVLHGVPSDLIPVRGAGGLRFLGLDDFLCGELFASWPSVLTYNRAEGLGFATPAARSHFLDRMKAYDVVHGTSWADGLPRDAPNCFALLDSYFRHCASLVPARAVALLLPFAETLVPNSEAAYRTPEDRAVLVYLRKWSQDPVLLAKNVVVVMIAESLAELDPQLVRSHATRELEIERPDAAERLAYLAAVRSPDWYAKTSELTPSQLADLTAGMTRVQIAQLLDEADAPLTGAAEDARLTAGRVRQVKKEVIETEGLGLLEYVEPKFDLGMVAGMPAVKARLRRAARAISRGNPTAVPMGYLVCGPVGSAKTFLVECFAKEIGFPVVKLKNFRSMWVGSTESNLERILKILASLTPVGVMIDEADTALGNREQSGDSGTQNRVFGQIASFMGDTKNRGKILWFLITARPDLLPIDLKRQGRAEEHIPLFYPETVPEVDEIFQVMKTKLGLKTQVATLAEATDEASLLGLSGSDLEAILVRATLEAEAADSREVTADHLKRAFADFIPTTNSREREMQILAAVLECTSRELLPAKYQDLDRGAAQARIEEIKRMLRVL
ncbi:MAG TPA: AAA family ATPase [Thermoanaerobaculia bacterium]|nr:AAA family ATPase [Thermoanaerobaculia bacterium]